MSKKTIFLSTTYVDAKTNIPMNLEPCRNGYKIPDGVVPVFDLMEQRWSDTPTVFGWAEEGFELQVYMSEVDEDSFWEIFKQELKDRVKSKRKQVEEQGIMFGDAFVETSIGDQNRISNVVANIGLTDIETIKFDTGGDSVEMTVEELKALACAVALHVQECFTWAGNTYEAINNLELSLETLEDVQPILESINMFGVQEEFSLEEEMGDV